MYKGELFTDATRSRGCTMDHIVGGKTDVLHEEVAERLKKRGEAEGVVARSRARKAKQQDEFRREQGIGRQGRDGGEARSDVERDVKVPAAPFYGNRVIEGWISTRSTVHQPVAAVPGPVAVQEGSLSDAEYQAIARDKVYPIFEDLKVRCARRSANGESWCTATGLPVRWR